MSIEPPVPQPLLTLSREREIGLRVEPGAIEVNRAAAGHALDIDQALDAAERVAGIDEVDRAAGALRSLCCDHAVVLDVFRIDRGQCRPHWPATLMVPLLRVPDRAALEVDRAARSCPAFAAIVPEFWTMPVSVVR